MISPSSRRQPKSKVSTPSRTIKAWPTKEFFISMLTKDIPLDRAIIDLIDNSLDGIRRLRRRRLSAFEIDITVSPDTFTIRDNCGGISVTEAREYAFRFGRPTEAPPTPHSIGQFGVGMKRALFKLGNQFTIESRTAESYFEVSEDVEEWQSRSDNLDGWSFRFKVLKELPDHLPSSPEGTTIRVADLHAGVKKEFASSIWLNRLRIEIAAAHQISIVKGLKIRLNGKQLTAKESTLKEAPQIKSAHVSYKFNGTQKPVIATLYVGVSGSDPEHAGWNVYCNDRLVLDSDQTITTGWGEGMGRTIPKYHNQFANFRGFVFFDCDESSQLPWNTTKTGVDSGSPLFERVRTEMITLMRPVIDFLNALDKEKTPDLRSTPLTEALENSKPVSLSKINRRKSFQAPTVQRQAKPQKRGQTISYSKPKQMVDEMKRALRVRTKDEVGERSFDIVYTTECENEE